MNHGEEMHIEGFEVSFLIKIEDVTERILADVNDSMTEAERNAAIQAAQAAIYEEQNSNNPNNYQFEINSFYYGNEYYMFVYNTYNDIRLVAAPPESVGKFGGDQPTSCLL